MGQLGQVASNLKSNMQVVLNRMLTTAYRSVNKMPMGSAISRGVCTAIGQLLHSSTSRGFSPVNTPLGFKNSQDFQLYLLPLS